MQYVMRADNTPTAAPSPAEVLPSGRNRRSTTSRRRNAALLQAAPAAVLPYSWLSQTAQRESSWAEAGWLPLVLTAALITLMIVLVVMAVRDFRSYQRRETLSGDSSRLRDPRERFRRTPPVDDAASEEPDEALDEAVPASTRLAQVAANVTDSTAALFARAIAGIARLPTLAGSLLRRPQADDEDAEAQTAAPPAAARRRAGAVGASYQPPNRVTNDDDDDDDGDAPIDWTDLPDDERTRWADAVDGEQPLPSSERRSRRLPEDEHSRWHSDVGNSGRLPHARPGNSAGLPSGEHERWHREIDTGKTLGAARSNRARSDHDDDEEQLLEDLLGV